MAPPVVKLTLFWIAGILLGWATGGAAVWVWISLLAAITAAIAWARSHVESAQCWALLASLCLSSAWYGVRAHHIASDHVAQYLSAEPQLAQVLGTVEGEPRIRRAQSGAFARFSYRAPVTVGLLDLKTITVGDHAISCSGRLLMTISEADHRLRRGAVISAKGWLSRFEAPLNPGELDQRSILRHLEIDGRLTLPSRGNWRCIDSGTDRPRSAHWRDQLSDAAAASLRAGMGDRPRRLALLETILLGRRPAERALLAESFRRVGLAHLLSISGAHLAILLSMVWFIARLIVDRPSQAAIAVLVVLGLFLAVVPWRVPIVRAGMMAAVFTLTHLGGRQVSRLSLLAGAALVVLVWRPADLFDAGFQLSFAAVAGLVLFVAPLSRWIVAERTGGTPRHPFVHRLADLLAVNVVAFAIVLPLVAFHFQMITPYAVPLSILMFPVISAVLGLGYVKLLLTAAYPSIAAVLAPALEWLTGLLIWCIDHVSRWPGATIELPQAPSAAWTLATASLVLALLAGRFARRRAAMVTAVVICLLWLVLSAVPAARQSTWLGTAAEPAVRLNMLAVGDGSCYLVRLDSGRGRSHVIMFDCGSQQQMNLAERTVLPVLRYLGTNSIDTLIISHADIDHYGGTLDLMDKVRVARVVTHPYLIADASADDDSAAAFLLEQLIARGARLEMAQAGWHEVHGGAELDVLWPPPGLVAPLRNDTSIVLRISAAGRRILLCGDIQQNAIEHLLAGRTEVRADVCDLPHHGSLVEASPRFLDRIKATLVLQSCGRRRLRNDPWKNLLNDRTIRRLISARDGMVQITIDRNGRITTETFK